MKRTILLIINITLSSNVIGLKDDETFYLLACNHVIGQLDKQVTIKLHFK